VVAVVLSVVRAGLTALATLSLVAREVFVARGTHDTPVTVSSLRWLVASVLMVAVRAACE
jgi:hypothetical protein